VYVPPPFAVADESALFDFIDAHGFAVLVTAAPDGPIVTHLPLLLDRPTRTLVGHVARANGHWRRFADGPAVAVFAGPHGYVSPTWYATTPSVPTWNYTAVHVASRPRAVDAPAWVGEAVDALSRKYEAGRPRPWSGELPAAYRAKMLAAVVGVELPIERIEGKFKLSQNRSPADRAGVAAGLEADGNPDLAALVRAVV
jgi:transcriptional regulator